MVYHLIFHENIHYKQNLSFYHSGSNRAHQVTIVTKTVYHSCNVDQPERATDWPKEKKGFRYFRCFDVCLRSCLTQYIYRYRFAIVKQWHCNVIRYGSDAKHWSWHVLQVTTVPTLYDRLGTCQRVREPLWKWVAARLLHSSETVMNAKSWNQNDEKVDNLLISRTRKSSGILLLRNGFPLLPNRT